jgi:enamine deaminase RidA (YjgF/YER057c/UK114 family)
MLMPDDPRTIGDRIQVVTVPTFPAPKGYANGIVASGRRLYVAGQVGWNEREEFVSEDVGDQFVTALDNVLAVVAAAGGAAGDIVKMTVFVTDVDGYVAARPRLKDAWRARFGRHYPAMALIGIARLFEPGAKVEIEAIAELREGA